MPSPSTIYPVFPAVEATRYLVPVQADTLASIAQQILHLLGWRGRIHSPGHVAYQQSGGVTIEGTSPSGVADTVRHWFQSTPYTTHVLLVFNYQAYAASGSQYIRAKLDDLTLASTIDGGCEWSQNNGRLNIERDRDEQFGANGYRYPIRVAHTGVRLEDSPAVTPSRPRPLFVPAASRGNLIEVEWSTNNARLHDFAVIEMFEPEVS